MCNEKLGVCVVGCGAMGTRHGLIWHDLPTTTVVAVSDVSPKAAASLAKRLGIDRWTTDYRKAIEHPEVDIVSVCTPTSLHAAVTYFAAAHGRHVFCEKPIALTIADANAMIEAATGYGVRLGIGFMRRFSPVMSSLRQWLAKGTLGRPLLYHATNIMEIRPKRAMHDAQMNGGPVLDMAVHFFDTWAHLFGAQAVSVMARGLTLARGRPELDHIERLAHDTASIIVDYSSGDIGTFVVSWGVPPGVVQPNIDERIYGPAGLARARFAYQDQEVQAIHENGQWQTIFRSDADMYRLELEQFVQAVRDEAPVRVSGEDGREALRVALAALESIKCGQTVYLT